MFVYLLIVKMHIELYETAERNSLFIDVKIINKSHIID